MTVKKICLENDLYKHSAVPLQFHLSKLTTDYGIHEHDCSELSIILGGQAVHYIDGEEYEIGRGDVYVIKGHQKHALTDVRSLVLGNINYREGYFFDCSPMPTDLKGYQCLFNLEPAYRTNHRFRSRLRLSSTSLEEAREIIYKVSDEYRHNFPGYESMLVSYFLWLTVFLSREYERTPENQNNELLQIASAVAFLENKYAGEIRLSDVAAQACFSERHFERVFKKYYKMSPFEYVLQLRLSHAKRLMRNPKFSLTEIAFDSGFNDSNYFSRVFHKKTGLTPGEFRLKIL